MWLQNGWHIRVYFFWWLIAYFVLKILILMDKIFNLLWKFYLKNMVLQVLKKQIQIFLTLNMDRSNKLHLLLMIIIKFFTFVFRWLKNESFCLGSKCTGTIDMFSSLFFEFLKLIANVIFLFNINHACNKTDFKKYHLPMREKTVIS